MVYLQMSGILFLNSLNWIVVLLHKWGVQFCCTQVKQGVRNKKFEINVSRDDWLKDENKDIESLFSTNTSIKNLIIQKSDESIN